MICKVMKDEEYYSYIFFICKFDYRTKVIVFNNNSNKFELVDAFKNKYTSELNISLFDYKEEGLIEKNSFNFSNFEAIDCMGYDWIINNSKLLLDIENGNEVGEEYLSIAREMNSTIDVFKWHEINDEKDVEELVDISGAFHDSYLRDFKYIFTRPFLPDIQTKLQIGFEMYGNHFDILLEFSDELLVKFPIGNNLNYIYLSTILFHDGYVYWVEGADDLSVIDIEYNSYVRAKKLRWKIIPKL